MINLDTIAQAPVAHSPFSYLTATGVLNPMALQEISRDFPLITKPGIFPLSTLQYGPAFGRLVEEIKSAAFAQVMADKFAVDLRDKPLMITVRGQCQLKDGRIHADSKDKIVTCLLYLNEQDWENRGGRLRLLRSEHDLNDMIAEVPPNGGNFVAFKRADNSWHGHAPFIGQRRYVMFNWVASEATLAKNLGRHRLSAFFKRFASETAY